MSRSTAYSPLSQTDVSDSEAESTVTAKHNDKQHSQREDFAVPGKGQTPQKTDCKNHQNIVVQCCDNDDNENEISLDAVSNLHRKARSDSDDGDSSGFAIDESFTSSSRLQWSTCYLSRCLPKSLCGCIVLLISVFLVGIILTFVIASYLTSRDLVFVYDGVVYRVFSPFETIYDANACEDLFATMTGSNDTAPPSHELFPSFIDHIYISHYAAAHDRAASIEKSISRMGWNQFYELRSEWNRSRVASEFASNRHLSHWIWREGHGSNSSSGTLMINTSDARNAIPPVNPPEPARDALLGVAANFMEHMSIYDQIIKRNQSYALILEDDVFFANDAKQGICTALRDLKAKRIKFEILMVGQCSRKSVTPPSTVEGCPATRITDHVYRVHCHRCASAYIVSREAAEKLLTGPSFNEIDPGMNTIDGYIGDMMIEPKERNGLLESFWLEPAGVAYEGTKVLNPPYASTRDDMWFGFIPI